MTQGVLRSVLRLRNIVHRTYKYSNGSNHGQTTIVHQFLIITPSIVAYYQLCAVNEDFPLPGLRMISSVGCSSATML